LEVRIVLAASENDANFGSGTLGAATSRNKAEIQEQNSRASLRNHKCRGKCCSRDRHMRCISAAPAFGLVLFLMPVITACATSVRREQGGLLWSYQHLAPSNGVLTQAQVSVNRDVILEAKTVRIIPTSLSVAVAEAKLSEAQLRLIANAVDRSLCTGL